MKNLPILYNIRHTETCVRGFHILAEIKRGTSGGVAEIVECELTVAPARFEAGGRKAAHLRFARKGGQELIDDCAVARRIKGRPPRRAIWLGLSRAVVSLRDNLIRVSPNIYNTPGDIERFLAAAAG